MPRRSPEYMASQRDRFFEAAVACFRRKGIAATSLTHIADEVGVSLGALYKHFPTREAFLRAFLASRLAVRDTILRGETWAELREAMLTAREAADRHAYWREFQGRAEWNRMLHDLWLEAALRTLEHLEARLERFAASGEITLPFDARRTARLINLVSEGVVSLSAIPELITTREDLADYLDFIVGAVN